MELLKQLRGQQCAYHFAVFQTLVEQNIERGSTLRVCEGEAKRWHQHP
jgi:hypothetical protein